jgi:ferredoxin
MLASAADGLTRKLSARFVSKNPFAGPAQRSTSMPRWAWIALRLFLLAFTGAIIWLLLSQPRLGVAVFWLIAVPGLPLLFLVAPGFWRNVCPMATLNQLPAQLGLSAKLRLPSVLKQNAYLVAVGLFLGLIFLRHPLLNDDPGALLLMLTAALASALLGGALFEGKSGWCGTFCPMSPIERAYGQSPAIVVSNSHCSVCNNCQKNCYDINPNAAIFKDLEDDSAWYVENRKLFFGALPGFIYWFFSTADPGQIGYGAYLAGLAQSVIATLCLFYAAVYLTRLRLFHVVQLFTVSAILIFYWFAAPAVQVGLSELFSINIPRWTVPALQVFVVLAVVLTWIRGLGHELAYRQRVPVQDQSNGLSFSVVRGQPLLEAIEAAGISIRHMCRRGQCGSDPIVIVIGEENVDAAKGDELQTLRRLGLEGKVRLACSCIVNGPITIDTEAGKLAKIDALKRPGFVCPNAGGGGN